MKDGAIGFLLILVLFVAVAYKLGDKVGYNRAIQGVGDGTIIVQEIPASPKFIGVEK